MNRKDFRPSITIEKTDPQYLLFHKIDREHKQLDKERNNFAKKYYKKSYIELSNKQQEDIDEALKEYGKDRSYETYKKYVEENRKKKKKYHSKE